MVELQPIIVFRGSHFVRHLGIFNLIYVKLVQIMSGVIPRNLKKTTSLSQTVFLASTNEAHTHTHTHTDTHTHRDRHTQTHTHDDSIKQNAMPCISPKNECPCMSADKSAIFAYSYGLFVAVCEHVSLPPFNNKKYEQMGVGKAQNRFRHEIWTVHFFL